MLMEAESHVCKTGQIACFSNTNDHSTYQTYLDDRRLRLAFRTLICPSCAAPLPLPLPLPLQPRRQGGGNEVWPWGTLPAGVKFDPSDQQILEHLKAKVNQDTLKLHPLIPEFIPTLEGDDGICYTHPQNLPGMKKDGQIRHFFHRPSKAYTAGRRKRRKVHTDEEQEYETRWHKTGKTRPVVGPDGGGVMGFKKILVLYTNYGSQRKPQKTNWIMHQYHLGVTEDEEDGQLVASKVFFQTQPRQSSSSYHNTFKDWDGRASENNRCNSAEAAAVIDYGVPREFGSSTSYGEEMQYRENLA